MEVRRISLVSGLGVSTSYRFSYGGQGQNFYNINGNGICEGSCPEEAGPLVRTPWIVLIFNAFSHQPGVGFSDLFKLEDKPWERGIKSLDAVKFFL